MILVDLQKWVLVWICVAAFLVARHWRAGRNVGLLLGYVVCFGAIDWFASALCLLPWSPSTSFQFVTDGMRLSAYGMAAFAVGAEVGAFAMNRNAERDTDRGITIDSRVVNLYLAVGLFLHVAMAPLARNIPSVNALVGAGSSLAVLAIALKCWNAWHENRRHLVLPWLAASCCFPIFTVVTQGFLGYGLSSMLMIVAFVAAFNGPRLKVIVGGVLLAYLGLSVYVTYMRDRSEIRMLVRGGAGLSDRMAQVRDMVAQFEWFDPHDDAHLRRIDDRLNQNWLVGAAVQKLSSGTVAFAEGSTLWDAVLAIVPRALWPEKTVSAGSGDLVSIYTGLRFQGDTSVGIGQLMECYVNFGVAGVFVGFFLLGALIMLIDRTAVRALRAGHAGAFLLWYLPGLNLLNVGGSFVDASSSAAAAFVLATIMVIVTNRLTGHPARLAVAFAGRGPAPDDLRP